MQQETTNQLLNRLLVIHNRSLPIYLRSAVPWWADRGQHARATLDQIVADQQHMVDRIGTLIIENNGRVELGEFPISFTALHDLSGDFLVLKMCEYQRQSVAAIERIVARLADQPRPHALAQQAFGMAQAHLDMLDELARHAVDASV